MLKIGLTAGVMLVSLTTAAMAQDKTVVVYTAHKASIVDALVPKFEKETGIKVDVVKAGSGDIIKRVKAESSSAKACNNKQRVLRVFRRKRQKVVFVAKKRDRFFGDFVCGAHVFRFFDDAVDVV